MNIEAFSAKPTTLGVALALAMAMPGHISAQALHLSDAADRALESSVAEVRTAAEAAILEQEENDPSLALANAVRLVAEKGFSVVLLGSEDFKSKFGPYFVSNNPPIKQSQRIIIVESGTQSPGSALKFMAQSDFIIVLGDSAVDTTHAEFSQLFDIETHGVSQKSLAEYQSEIPKIATDRGNGMLVGDTVAGYFYDTNAPSASYHSAVQDERLALARTIHWALETAEGYIVQRGAPKAGTWTLRYERQEDNTCLHSNGSTVVGWYSSRTKFSRLTESNTTKDVIEIKYTTEMVPRISTTEPDKKFYNGDVTLYNPYRLRDSRFNLKDYGPETTVTGSTQSVDLAFSFNGLSVGRSWSYSVPSVVVANYSSLANDSTKWVHDIDQNSLSGKTTFKMEPGAVVEVPNGFSNPWTKMREEYDFTWVKLASNGSVQSTYRCRKTYY